MGRFKHLENSFVIILIVTSAYLPLSSLEVDGVDEVSHFPVTMSTVLGGSSAEYSSKILVDTHGNFIVLGISYSSDFLNIPEAPNYYSNPFVAEISPGGSLQWLTFLADNGTGIGMDLALDNDNNIYAVGEIHSNNFLKANVNLKISSDGFISKISSKGTLLWTKLIGGSSSEMLNSILLTANNTVLIAGRTMSSDFPLTNMSSLLLKDSDNVFISKLDENGNVFWTKIFGGSEGEWISSVDIDSDNCLIVTGTTLSGDFPTKLAFNNVSNDYHPGTTDSGDVFITKLFLNGTIIWSTYLGGNISDNGHVIRHDEYNNYFILGFAHSSDFPVINSSEPFFSDQRKLFLAKFSSTGQVIWSTFLPGFISENADLFVYPDGTSLVAGTINETTNDISILEINQDGTPQSSYNFTGQFSDSATGIIATSYDLIVTGTTYSTDFPRTSKEIIGSGGSGDVFVSVLPAFEYHSVTLTTKPVNKTTSLSMNSLTIYATLILILFANKLKKRV